MLVTYFLIGLLLVGAVLYWQDELGVAPNRGSYGSVSHDVLIFSCIGVFFLWPVTAVVLGACFLRKRKIESRRR